MAYKTIHMVLAAALITAGTFTVGYPAGTSRGDFIGGVEHVIVAGQSTLRSPTDFTVSFGASNATVTYTGATTIPAGTDLYVQLDMAGRDGWQPPATVDGVTPAALVQIELGSPVAADADGVCASQAITAAGGGAINGALASGGVATFDVPRNVVAAWTTTAVMTVTGTDANGEPLVESSASGTSLAGKKAFKTVTSVAVSADVTGATVGTGDVLGLPVYLPNGANVLKELENGAAATAGTLVAGLSPGTKSTATTADVRGTYDPNSACDGSKGFALIAALPNPAHLGNPQFAG